MLSASAFVSIECSTKKFLKLSKQTDMNEQDFVKKMCVEVLNEIDNEHNILAEKFKPMYDGTLWFSMYEHIDDFVEKLRQKGVSLSASSVLESV